MLIVPAPPRAPPHRPPSAPPHAFEPPQRNPHTPALGGASFLVLADLGARVALAPIELPVGIVTALVGGPFFLYLLQRSKRPHAL